MKSTKISLIATLMAAIICVSFTVKQNSKNESKIPTKNKNAITLDCFKTLMSNLKEINAIICIPDVKLDRGKDLSLQVVQPKNELINLDDYIPVTPVVSTDPCLKNSKATFDDLQLIVYVKKIHQSKLTAFNLVKINAPVFKILTKNIKIGNKLQILIDDTTAGFTQVELK
jgi:hypothetical protein